jgi:UDP-N-acetyl-D-galactosamine dehydrogenase
MPEAVAVIGLGYVGLPVAVAFGQVGAVVGFDISAERVAELRRGFDRTGEVDHKTLSALGNATFTSSAEEMREATTFIVCVPTPIKDDTTPDLDPLLQASRTVGAVLKRGDLVVFESTVYPGATEEACLPILEEVSGLDLNDDFMLGYSPERINPGDKTRRFEDIRKVVSGSSELALDRVANLYASVVNAGVYRASSIKVAEAAKVIENTQRDLNIALINELSKIFQLLDIDTNEVLRAASTKWNFVPFSPGLVGGHCIGVDPFYLTHKSQEVGYTPKVILAGREVNDSMGHYVADRAYELWSSQKGAQASWSVLVLGATFKENCPDVRNSRVVDLVRGLKANGASVTLADPWVEPVDRQFISEATWVDWIELVRDIGEPGQQTFDAIIVAVAHGEFIASAEAIRGLVNRSGIVFDVKGALPADLVDDRL